MRTWKCLVLIAAVWIVSQPAHAEILTFALGQEYSGAYSPEGPSPWLIATFDDGGTPASVTLTLDAGNLTGSEFVSKWLFNLDPVLDPLDLEFLALTKVGSFDDPVIRVGVNDFKAAGNEQFDIEFGFATRKSGRFGAGDSMTVEITGIATLTADSFNYLSAPGGAYGPFPTAAHVQSIGEGEDSGWLTVAEDGGVPEPSAIVLLSGALASLALARLVRMRRYGTVARGQAAVGFSRDKRSGTHR